MSALGQKQTFAVHQAMSALPPKATLDAPEVLKSRRRQLSIPYGVLYVAMAEVRLQRPRIMPSIG